MKIYTETTISFSKKCELFLKEIIESETELKLRKSRFEYNRYSYPIHIVIFTNSRNLGYFDPSTFQIGLHINLMYQVKDHVLKNILRHELAHYLCFIQTQDIDAPHGEAFKKVCLTHGWNESVSKASMHIQTANDFVGNLESERIIKKIKALLSLAQSDNKHEAELATLKANQLLLKYNLKSLSGEQSFELFVDTVYTAKRRNAKMSTIYEILKHFLVKPVFIHGHKQTSLEVSGSRENIELAQYITNFLDRELEILWKEATHLKGQRAKNSFFAGIAKGYDEKYVQLTTKFCAKEQKSLISLNQNLEHNVARVYKRLSSTSSTANTDRNAFSNGKEKGKNLTINTAIKNKAKTFLLNWR